jgi:hypothetical protein
VSGVGIESELSAQSLTLRGLRRGGMRSSQRDRRRLDLPSHDPVTLPSVHDFPDLTACQRQRVRDAISNVLAPHEQRHVGAFRTYNGTVRTPFSITLCGADFDSSIQAVHDSVEANPPQFRSGRQRRARSLLVRRRYQLLLGPPGKPQRRARARQHSLARRRT